MADSILASPEQLGPEWLAHRFEETTGNIRFVDYDRATRRSVPFLTDDHLPPRAHRTLSRRQAEAIQQSAPIHFIFHSGFCCSTLLVSALDMPGLASGFSEPTILNDIVGWRLRGGAPNSVGLALADALRLLGRPFDDDQAAVIKPSNVVNGLGKAMLAIQPEAKAVVMYAPLSDFLVSIAKKGLEGRTWVRELFVKLRAEGRVQKLGFTDLDFLGQTDLQIAAMAWLAQQCQFEELIAGTSGRVVSLDSATFMENSEIALRRVAHHFGLNISHDQVTAAMAGAMTRDSKNGRRFNADDRKAEYDRMHGIHGDEIIKVVAWATHISRGANIPVSLGAQLIN